MRIVWVVIFTLISIGLSDCSKEELVVPGKPDEIYVADISQDTDWDFLVVGSESTDHLLVKQLDSKPVEAVWHVGAVDNDYSILFDPNGLLNKVVIEDHIILFSDFQEKSVDIAILSPDGTFQIQKGVNVGLDLIPPVGGRVSTKSDALRLAAYLIDAIPCIISAVSAITIPNPITIAMATWSCGSYLLTLAGEISGNLGYQNGLTELADKMQFYRQADAFLFCSVPPAEPNPLGFILSCLSSIVSEALFTIADDLDMIEERNAAIVIVENAISSQESGSFFIDSRDGQSYRTIKIGNQIWMASNLNYYAGPGTYCYQDDPADCLANGSLYTWAVSTSVAPAGWHIPSRVEFEELVASLGTAEEAYIKLIENGSSEFESFFVGFRNDDAGNSYVYAGQIVDYWSSTEINDDRTWVLDLNTIQAKARVVEDSKLRAFSIRCIKNQ